VHADASVELGSRDPKCLQLFEYVNTAVNFAKSGIPAIFPKELRTKRVPHFMVDDEEDSPKARYKSSKALGRIFDAVDSTKLKEAMNDFKGLHPQFFEQRHFDPDLVYLKHPRMETMIKIARELRNSYTNEIQNIKNQV
jgi:RNA-dependent RNA polymerase